jgi:hypothetical protein
MAGWGWRQLGGGDRSGVSGLGSVGVADVLLEPSEQQLGFPELGI